MKDTIEHSTIKFRIIGYLTLTLSCLKVIKTFLPQIIFYEDKIFLIVLI